ncbi:hypothetical protein GKZ89_15850 [Bacillus mangrovi]|uniref:VOC domain-containing protein n=1 Tax=Metabacillus mangrovi TaxID=1491830 RepID=A0A7X2S8T7_9BACI|nr:hypothetical protein [Metabacillus mangrovi]MTH54876.1 hypothetical protein [Metabacillus mangrovi]
MLFHYHYWTPHVEETEKFYRENGFRISQRVGRYQGEFQEFNPPLEWNDFREKNILFRIIEARRGAVNITFGFGKKVMFDHIGYLVTPENHDRICKNARNMGWDVQVSERRTFIATPYSFRIELQTSKDAIDGITEEAELQKLTIVTKRNGLENDLSLLFGQPVSHIVSETGEMVAIKEAFIKGMPDVTDPNGVRIYKR